MGDAVDSAELVAALNHRWVDATDNAQAFILVEAASDGDMATRRMGPLVIMVHGFDKQPCDFLPLIAHIREEGERELRSADFVIPEMNFRPVGAGALQSPYDALAKLVTLLDDLFDEERHSTVILAAASMGDIFARRLYACGLGEPTPGLYEEELRSALRRHDVDPSATHPWATRVSRIVVFAGLSRGWEIDHRMSPLHGLLLQVAVFVGWLLTKVGKRHIGMAARHGSPFVMQQRIHWARLHAIDPDNHPLLVQLLGSRDQLVSPRDQIDLEPAGRYAYIDLHNGDHNAATRPEEAAARAPMVHRAFTERSRALVEETVHPSDDPAPAPNPGVHRVVFVIHGIRDRGYWTHKIARTVVRQGRAEGLSIATETSSYGYFPALSFISPGRRHRKTVWFAEQYVQAIRRYPQAVFDFVGHSNGTYLLVDALRSYPSVRFEHVVLAGSVIPTRFDWDSLPAGQVRQVLNYRATRDFVLVLLTRRLERFGPLFRVGSAGHDGFRSVNAQVEQRTVVGGHAAAIKEDRWGEIADFVLHGPTAGPGAPPAKTDPPGLRLVIAVLAAVAPLVSLGAVAAVGYIAYRLWIAEAQAAGSALLAVGFVLGVVRLLQKI